MNLEKKLGIHLTKEQQKHLESVEWLIDCRENVTTGRTSLLAFVFIKMALKYPDMWIKPFDHYPYIQANERILTLIHQMLLYPEDKKLIGEVDFGREQFRIKKLKKENK